MNYKTITARVLPLDIESMLAHLRLDPVGSDAATEAQVLAYFGAACGMAQNFTNCAIGKQTLEFALDAFPCGPIRLPIAPVTAILDVSYADNDGVVQTALSTSYMLDDYSTDNWAVPAYGTEWPSTYAAVNAVKIQVEAGYTASTLPDDIRSALLLSLGHLFENRQDVVTGPAVSRLPQGAQALLWPYRRSLGV